MLNKNQLKPELILKISLAYFRPFSVAKSENLVEIMHYFSSIFGFFARKIFGNNLKLFLR